MSDQPRILVVDDDPAVLEMVAEFLSSIGYSAETASNGKEACALLEAQTYDLVLTDLMMPEMGGMELVQHLRVNYPETLAIMFTGFASFQNAVTATKLGAFDYLAKPLQLDILQHSIERALEYQRLCRAQRDLEVVFQGAEALGWQALDLITDSPQAAILRNLRLMVWEEQDLKAIGHCFLEAARDLVQATCSSIFLMDDVQGKFSLLAASGPQVQTQASVAVSATEGVMGYVAANRRPLLVPDLKRDPRFPLLPLRPYYQTNSFMVIPLTGYRFWGVMNLADRQDKQPFAPRDLFLAWLMGRILVEILESRKVPEELATPWTHEDIPLGLGLLDQNLKIMQCNPAMERLVTLKGDLTGKEVFPYLGLTSQDQEKLEEAFRQVLATHQPQEFATLKTLLQDKVAKFFRIKMLPWVTDRENNRGLLLVEDVSEMEHLKQRLHLYEHLAIMGKLTLCVVHELNNPLDGIRRYLSLALIKKDDAKEVERYLSEAQKGLQKMALSLNSLMFSANPYKAPPQTMDNLHNLLQDAVKIMMFQASDQRVQVAFHAPPEFQELIVEADLYYVFINIIKNALQAMPHGGHLKVDGYLHDRQVEIAFQDSGLGLSARELEQISQPFYTTKKTGEGLGLGLPICQKILERYKGNLLVESKPGQGTTVKIILPHVSERKECQLKTS
ncbi:MAG: response regulator [Deltaproteobacteria bacterium]|nr:response regulator [Deltaproteobacteria bacterium]